jgi:hypothetical protein
MRQAGLAAAMFALAGSASAAPGDMIAVEKIAASGAVVTVTVKNTGTTQLVAFQGFLPEGVRVLSVSATPAGPVCGGGGTISNTGACFFPDGQRWLPGETRTFAFMLDKATQGTMRLCVNSSFGSADVCTTAQVSKPCECERLDTQTALASGKNTGKVQIFVIALTAKLYCLGGTGNCSGQVELLPPKRDTDIDIVGSGDPFTCKGKCGAVATRRDLAFHIRSADLAKPDKRKGERYSLRIRTACIDDGKRVRPRIETMTFVFDKQGGIDSAKSDLNADGKPDRKK